MNITPNNTHPIANPHLCILSQAAFFAGDFSIDWLQELTCEKASAIFAALEWGVERGWLSRINPALFSFIDTKEQEALRKELSAGEINDIHCRIAILLDRDMPEGPERTIRTGYHLLNLSNDYNGCQTLVENGNIHRRRFRDEEARHFYEKALTDLRKQAGAHVDRLFVQSALEYCKVSTDSDNPNRVIAIIEEAIGRAGSIDDKNAIGIFEMHLGKSEWLRSRYPEALNHFERGWALSRTTDDATIQKSATIFGMFYNFWSGRYREVVQVYETLVPDVEDQFPKGRLPLLAALTAGVCLGHTGHYSQALGMLHAIRGHSRSIGNHSMAGLAGVSLGYLLLELHRPEDAVKCIEDSREDTEAGKSIYARLGALGLLGYAYHLVGNHQLAVSCLHDYQEASRQFQMTVKFTALWMQICRAMEDGSFPPMDGFSLDNEISYSLKSGNLLMRGVAHRYLALKMRQAGEPSNAILCELDQSVVDLETCGHQVELAASRLEIAREHIRMGNYDKALAFAGPAARTLHAFNDALVPDDIRPLVKDLRNGNDLLDEILRLGQELTTIRDYRELTKRIISAINRITGAERGAIFLIEDGHPDKIMLRSAKNLTVEDVELPEFDRSRKLIEETARSSKGMILEALEREQPEGARTGNVIQSCICVPLKIRNTLKGVLYHDNRLFRSAFRESDLEILHYFATQAAIAMDNAEAWETLQQLYEKQQLEKEHYEKEYLETIHFGDFVGESPAIRQVFAQARQVAETDATVLILGETGVGKELVARFIHRHCDRADKPFIRVHCGALAEGLVTSELFGHEKGAFTGAMSRQIGRFELANGGTIFLDEIGDISLDVQVLLLRVLQSKSFERVGGRHTLHSDFRLLAATNRNLEAAVEQGRFRRDLYYRLNVFPITVPPLRNRKEDIPLLARYFIQLHAKKCNKPVRRLMPGELEKLVSYDWPGNVRELENVMERGVILAKHSGYKLPDLATGNAPQDDNTCISLRENERNHILRVLKKTRGKVTGPRGAAEILDIHPNTLFSRMKKLGISRKAHYVPRSP